MAGFLGACFQNGFSKLYIEEQFGLRCHILQVLDLRPEPEVSLLSGRYEYAVSIIPESPRRVMQVFLVFSPLKIDTFRALGQNSRKT